MEIIGTVHSFDSILISIIIPVYNSLPYLFKCLQSLVNQIRPGIEIIIIDDGSTDGSSIVCDEYAAKYEFVKVVHQRNKGVSSARNTGLDTAIGLYVGFVDADDWVTLDYFDVLLNNINEQKADFYYFNFTRENGDIIALKLQARNAIDIIIELWETYQHISCWRCLIKREIVQSCDIRFTPGRRYGEDQEFALKAITCCASITAVDAALYVYRQNQNSAVFKTTYAQFQDVEAMRAVLNYALDKAEDVDKLSAAYYNQRFVHSVYVAVYQLLRAKEPPIKVLDFLNKSNYTQMIKRSQPSLPKYKRFQQYMSVCPTLCLWLLYLRGFVGRTIYFTKGCRTWLINWISWTS